MSRAFENDPRLKNMDPARLSALRSMAGELETAPDGQKMAAFLSVSQRAAREHISFSPEERELLIQILMEHMSGEERKKAEAVKRLAGRMQKNRPGA